MRVGRGTGPDDGAGALGGVDDLGGRLIDQLVVEGLQADADFFLLDFQREDMLISRQIRLTR
jgi:hypothetical protein